MDDGGQRLLDVIEDTHVLETFLRESFSSSGLEEPNRFDHGGSATESCLSVGGGLENFMFDGQLVDPLRPCPPHPSHHTHQVSSHILQGVLHSPNLTTTTSTIPIHSHQNHHSHHHHPHHHHHHTVHSQQPHLGAHHHSQLPLHQHNSQLHANHHSLTNTLDADCLARVARDPCSLVRNEADHTLQQLLASPALGTSQQLAQLHQQSQLPIQHQSHSHLHQLSPHAHPLGQTQQSLLQNPVIPTSSLSSPSSLHQHHQSHIPHHVNSHSIKSHHSQQTLGHHDVPNGIVPMGLPPLLSSSSLLPCSSISSHSTILTSDESAHSSSRHHAVTTTPKITGVSPSSISRSATHISQKINICETSNQVHSSASSVFSPSNHALCTQSISQLVSNVASTSQNQILPPTNVSCATTSRNFQNGQGLVSPTLGISNNLNSSQGTPTASVSKNTSSLFPSKSTSNLHSTTPSLISKSTEPASNIASHPSSTSSFVVPNKSPSSSLPRASPSPSYSATSSPHHTNQSPASYHTKSPAPSPRSNSLKSPVTPLSPTVTSNIVPSHSVQAVVTSNSLLPPRIVPSVGLVSHLPISQNCPSTGLVLTPSGTSVQVAPAIKQVVPTGQVIQLVSSQNNQSRQTITIPHPKPIQPKQPQLLPKPSPHGQTVRQSTPPPPTGKTLIGPRPVPPNTQPIVLGTGTQPAVITGQQNLGGLVLNSSLLQAGLQQPILIPQPNGVQLLVRPMGQPSNAGNQALLVPVPNQSQVVTSLGKAPQPPTLMIPGSGQTPAFVIPQGLTSAIGNTGVLGGAQASRPTPQPIIRFVAPQAPLQLQQINTPTGPMFVAVPVGQTTLNLSTAGMFATSSPVRALAPHVASSTLQIGSSLGPVNLNSVQIPNISLHSSSTAGHITSTVDSSSPSVQISSNSRSEANLLQLNSSNIQSNDSLLDSNRNKKKPKKKKKETKEDKGKNKTVSINLNELLKETGIFDENEFGNLGIEETEAETSVISTIPSSESLNPATTAISITSTTSSTSDALRISTTGNQLLLNSAASSLLQNHSINPPILTLNGAHVDIASQSTLPLTNIQPGMCLTLDASGKLLLGEAVKQPIAAIATAGPQLLSTNGANVSSSGPILFSNTQAMRPSLSKNNILTVGESPNAKPCLIKVDNSVNSKSIGGINAGREKGRNTTTSCGNSLDQLKHPVIIPALGDHSETDSTLRIVTRNIDGTELKSLEIVPNLSSTTGVGLIATSSSNVNSSVFSDRLIPSSIIGGNFIIPVHSGTSPITFKEKPKSPSSSRDSDGIQSEELDSRAKKVHSNSSNKKKRKEKESPVLFLSDHPMLGSTPDKNKGNKVTLPPATASIISNGDANSKVNSSPNISLASSNTLLSVTSNSTVSTMAISGSSSTLLNGPKSSFSLAHPGSSPSTGFVIQPGHQVKQLILSPQNQEVLKRVHAQIQDLQAKKGPLREQDKALQQKLITEYKKIMATGTPVPVCHALTQPITNLSSGSHSSVKYSHSVGHKKILFTPNHKKSSFSQTKNETISSGIKGIVKIKVDHSPSSNSTESNNNSSMQSPRRTTTAASMPIIVAATKGCSLSGSNAALTPAVRHSTLASVAETVISATSATAGATGSHSHQKISLKSPSKSASSTQHLPHTPPQSMPATPQSPVSQQFSLPLTRDQLFEHQLRTDQTGACFPDYKAPFKSKIDACKRLIRFHVFNELHPTPAELADSDAQFEVQSEVLLRKFKSMKHKYQSLLLKDSMRRHPSSETAMLYRMFIQEERHSLERLKLEASKGKEINLPPLPKHWLHPDPPQSPDPPFPWELDWHKDKIYFVNSKDPFSVLSEDDELDSCCRVDTPLWEAEDEGRLQIMMEEEEDRLGASPDDLPCPRAESLDALEAEVQNEYLDDRICGTDLSPRSRSPLFTSRYNSSGKLNTNNHSRIKSCYYPTDDQEGSTKLFNRCSDSNLGRSFRNCNDGVVLHGPSSQSGLILKDGCAASPSSLIGGSYCDPAERHLLNNCDERGRKHRRGVDHVKKRPKSRRDSGGGSDRSISPPPRSKIKIRLKGEEKSSPAAVVPPLRIRSDGGVDLRIRSLDHVNNRSSLGGGLKLTLKKQEGSGDYYRVGDESLKNDCEAVIRSKAAEAFLDEPVKRRLEVVPVNGQLKDISIVLEDCLQNETTKEEGHRPVSVESAYRSSHSKRSKKLKSRQYIHRQVRPNGVPFEHNFARKKENVSELATEWGSQNPQILPSPTPPRNSSLFYDASRSHVKQQRGIPS